MVKPWMGIVRAAQQIPQLWQAADNAELVAAAVERNAGAA